MWNLFLFSGKNHFFEGKIILLSGIQIFKEDNMFLGASAYTNRPLKTSATKSQAHDMNSSTSTLVGYGLIHESCINHTHSPNTYIFSSKPIKAKTKDLNFC